MNGSPILDNHLHLDRKRGRGLDAVRDFVRAGGTHLMVVSNPSWHVDAPPTDPSAFEPIFRETIETVERATGLLPGRAYAVLGVHPALISRLVDDEGLDPADAADLMRSGIDVAAEHVDDGRAIALKSGRPHYPVSEPVRSAANDVLKHALERAAELDCAVQLHTEASEDLSEITRWGTERGLDPARVVKHFAGGELSGPVPSVISRREALVRAAEAGRPFMMETDYLDDPERPGAVLGPKLVPRRTAWLADSGHEEAIRIAHVETPATVYGIDTEATVSEGNSG